MSDDKRGRGKDGQPFKNGNTRADGSYTVGKNRPPAHGRFAKGDGRPRGRRPKGQKNLLTDWREELAAKVEGKTRDGRVVRITKQRMLVIKTLDRAMKASDRAAETSFAFADRSERAPPGPQLDDFVIIEAWLKAHGLGDTDDANDSADRPSDDLDVNGGVDGDA